MTAASRKLLESLLALPEAERLEIATELLVSVEGPVPTAGSDGDDEWSRAWLVELQRRSQAAAERQDAASTWEEARLRILRQLKAQ